MRFDGLVTPCYIINDEEYAQNITRFKAEFESRWNGRVLFGYSVKTNNFPYMLKAALAHGFGQRPAFVIANVMMMVVLERKK